MKVNLDAAADLRAEYQHALDVWTAEAERRDAAAESARIKYVHVHRTMAADARKMVRKYAALIAQIDAAVAVQKEETA